MARTIPDDLAEQISEAAHEKPTKKDERVEFISTGCVPLNLALSQKGRDGGVARGRIINFVGDGSSGKTLLALECCAWDYYNIKQVKSELFPPIKKIIIVYNNSEGVMDFPIRKMYTDEFVDFVEWTYLQTCEEVGRDIQRRIMNLKPGEHLLYVQDSIDSTISQAQKKRIEESIKKDKAEDGSYGTEKAKYYSQSFFNNLCGLQRGKDATLIFISQVRENLNAGMFGKKHYRTGGKSLDFYTHQVLWLYKKESLKKTRNGHDRVYGIRTLAKVERNKTALPYREAEFFIRLNYGIDNIQSAIDFLYGPKEKKIIWRENEITTTELRLICDDKEGRDYKILLRQVEEEWAEIEAGVRVEYTPKY